MRSFPFPATSLFYRGDELFATTVTDKLDKDECIVGHTGALVRIAGAKRETVFQSKKWGILSGAALASGAIVVGTTDSEILVLSPDGKVKKTMPSGLPPSHSPDFLVTGGTPEIVVVGSGASSNPKSYRAEQFDTTSWTRGKQLAFSSLGALSVSARGIARCTGKGYNSVDSWGLQEYRWKGGLKAIKTPTQRSSFCISTASGWFVSDSTTAAFVDLEGAVRWTLAESHAGGCALSDTRLAIVTGEAVVIVDTADGRVVESYRLDVSDEESFKVPCIVAASPSGHVAISTQARVLVVERAATPVTAVAARLKVAAGPTPAEIASAAKTGKKAADRQAAAANDVVVAVEVLTADLVKTDDAKVLKKLRAKLEKLDVLEARSEPKNEKRIAKCDKTIRARLKALPPGSPASQELANFLDVLTDS